VAAADAADELLGPALIKPSQPTSIRVKTILNKLPNITQYYWLLLTRDCNPGIPGSRPLSPIPNPGIGGVLIQAF